MFNLKLIINTPKKNMKTFLKFKFVFSYKIIFNYQFKNVKSENYLLFKIFISNVLKNLKNKMQNNFTNKFII
jgi:hypothetical protein